MKTKTIRFVLLTAAGGFLAGPVLAADAADPGSNRPSGCCVRQAAAAPQCPHAASTAKAGQSVPSEPARAALDHYLKIQTTLAQDSLQGLPERAEALAKVIQSGSLKGLAPQAVQQARSLAQAKDLAAARAAFKPLSQSLIQYAAADPALAGQYRQAYCPMAQAGWLQTGSTIENPYMGKAMLHCGQFKKEKQ